MKIPKVLVCCPSSIKKSYCDERYFNQLNSLNYPNMDVFICDNSDGMGYFNKIKSNGFHCFHVENKNKPSAQILAESHEQCRVKAVNGGYDYMLHLESDVFVPYNDIIQRLMIHRLPIVSAIYPSRHGDKRWFILQQQQFTGLEQHGLFVVTNLDNGDDINFIDGSVKKIFSNGIGCSLIRKDVFSKIKFTWKKDSDNHPDTFFYCELYKQGIKNYVDTSLLCEHENQMWSVLGGLA